MFYSQICTFSFFSVILLNIFLILKTTIIYNLLSYQIFSISSISIIVIFSTEHLDKTLKYKNLLTLFL